MRQKATIILTIAIVIIALIVLNAATYVTETQKPDSEWAPNRSTYHSGPTGTRALYDLLTELGCSVMRWRQLPEKLLGSDGRAVSTFVIVGATPIKFDDDEAEDLLAWVELGGRLVVVDRQPQEELLPQSGRWVVRALPIDFSGLSADPGNVQEMTNKVAPVRPVQPTFLTREIEEVMPSRLAARIHVSTAKLDVSSDEHEGLSEEGQPVESDSDESPQEWVSPAPVIHLGNSLLVDYSYGRGRIVLLSDPYLLSNGGISLKDNLRLATNVLAESGGLIAFDEYHHGHGIPRNALIAYFGGTPVLAISGQLVLLVLLILWTRGRRFARPLPLPYVDRRSKLEFVASMAELQERASSFDLAIENIYSRTRRALARYAGVDYNSPRSEIARQVAVRSSLDALQLETLMCQCEETINGAPIRWRQAIDLVRRLRQVERTLGLRVRSRHNRPAAENI